MRPSILERILFVRRTWLAAILAVAPGVAPGQGDQGSLKCRRAVGDDRELRSADTQPYTFDGVAGEIVLLNVGTTDDGDVLDRFGAVLCTGGCAARIELFNPGGELLAGPTTSIRWKLPVTGTYSVHVRDDDFMVGCGEEPFNKGWGKYRLTLHRFLPLARQCGGRLLCGQHVTRRLFSADRDLWNFAGHAGDSIRITLVTTDNGKPDPPPFRGCQGTLDARLKVYPPDADAENGNPIPELEDECPAAADHCYTLPVDGTYTIQVYNADGNAIAVPIPPCKGWGEYSLTLLWTARADGPPLCDCNGNGIEDGGEITPPTDENGNNVLDVCEPPPVFRRGDANGDGRYNITDPIITLCELFIGMGCPEMVCRDAADANDDAIVNLSDPVYSLGCLFNRMACPQPPFPDCGLDPTTGDFLNCASYGGCP